MYKKEYLKSIERFHTLEHKKVREELLQKVIDEKDLSIAEANFICGLIDSFKPMDENSPVLNRHDYKQCNFYNFKHLYLLYYGDFNGYSQTEDAYGIIPDHRKIKDIEELNTIHTKWLLEIEKDNKKSDILNFLIREIRKQEKAIEVYGKKIQLGYHAREYHKKVIQFHGKFIYQIVSEYYQELGGSEQTIDACGKTIVLNSFLHIHTLFRHFAASIKIHQQEKSYHFDENIDYNKIPQVVYDFLLLYFDKIKCTDFNEEVVYLNFKGTNYAIWFKAFSRQLKGKIKQNILRVETIYPIRERKEVAKVQSMTKVAINDDLMFYK